MAIFRLSAQVISRGKGQSAVAAAAYRSRSLLQDEITQEWQDYSSNAGDVLFTGIYAPKDAPEWARDRQSLWNEVERKEDRKNSQLAREIQLALPHELTELQQRYAVQDFVRDHFVKKGLVADVAIHRAHEYGDQRNTHAHILITLRQLGEDGWAKHKQRDGKRDDLEIWREQWAHIANRHLERYGHAARIDHRSLEEQGIDQEPQIHLGKNAAAMERDGIETDRGTVLLKIAAGNAMKFDPAAPLMIDPMRPPARLEPGPEPPQEPARRTLFRSFADAVAQLGKTMASLLLRVVEGQGREPAVSNDAVAALRPAQHETLLRRLEREARDPLAALREAIPKPIRARTNDLEYEH